MAARGHGRASLSYLLVDEAVEHAHQETLPEEERDQWSPCFQPKSAVAVTALVLGAENTCLLSPGSLKCSPDARRRENRRWKVNAPSAESNPLPSHI